MSLWYFTKEELQCSPSSEDSVLYEDEQNRRREGCAFISKAGMKLRSPQLTIATAIVFFHRFFIRHSFKKWDFLVVATACLFLAGKVEETPKKLRDVICVLYDHRKKEHPKPDSKEYEEQREKITNHERIVLETISFDLTIEHPYKYLLIFVKKLNITDRNLVQVAWNFVNDSLSTTLCLQFRPGYIAAAALHLAVKFLKDEALTQGKQMWTDLDIPLEDLEAIGNQILELYENPTNKSNQDKDGLVTHSAPSSSSSASSSPVSSSPPVEIEFKKENPSSSSHSQNSHHHNPQKFNIPATNNNGNNHTEQILISSHTSANNHHNENNYYGNNGTNNNKENSNQSHRPPSSPSSNFSSNSSSTASPSGLRSHEGRRDKEFRRFSPY